MHYQRVYTKGEAGPVESLVQPRPSVCIVSGCTKSPATGRRYCNKHYMRLFRYGSIEKPILDPKHVEITGQRFGTLVALSRNEDSSWQMQCDCGKVRRTFYWNLTQDKTPTCGDWDIHTRNAPPTYALAHSRMRRQKGTATNHTCFKCGAQAKQWAYNHEDPHERIDSSISKNPVVYSMSPDYYVAMCTPCHKTFDLEWIKRTREKDGHA